MCQAVSKSAVVMHCARALGTSTHHDARYHGRVSPSWPFCSMWHSVMAMFYRIQKRNPSQEACRDSQSVSCVLATCPVAMCSLALRKFLHLSECSPVCGIVSHYSGVCGKHSEFRNISFDVNISGALVDVVRRWSIGSPPLVVQVFARMP